MTQEINSCYNPGDLLLPNEWKVIPRKKVLIIPSNKASLANSNGFDEIAMLDLTNYSATDEEEVLKLTTL